MERIKDMLRRSWLFHLVSIVCMAVTLAFVLCDVAYANTSTTTVRVGYYENEVFCQRYGQGVLAIGEGVDECPLLAPRGLFG